MPGEVCYNQTNLSDKLSVAQLKAAYDENAKWLLSEKAVLAGILIYTVPEYSGMSLDEVIPLIGDEPQVSGTSVNPGETNISALLGDNGENEIPGEGKITFDVRFHAWLPGRQTRIKLLIDVEAQRDYFPGYDIVTRGVFYTARMISAQLGTEFADSDYNNIKKVYSIWICTHVPRYAENTVTEYAMSQKNLVGSFPLDKSRYDLQSVIVIGLAETPEEGAEIHRLLGAVFSEKLSLEEKKAILENEFRLSMTQKMDWRVKKMCNLSEGIWERGIQEGIEQGNIANMVSVLRNMLKKNMSPEEIAEISGKDLEYIQQLCRLISENPSASDEELAVSYIAYRRRQCEEE